MTNNKLENITYFLFHGRMATVVVKSKRAIHKEKKFSHSTVTHNTACIVEIELVIKVATQHT